MPRPIKFRCYVKDKGWVSGMDWNREGSGSSFLLENSETHHLMQFTGLLDKNDKEIYEGDILESTKPPERGVIVYKPSMFCIEMKHQCPMLGLWISDIGMEIIGNIHENKELITNK